MAAVRAAKRSPEPYISTLMIMSSVIYLYERWRLLELEAQIVWCDERTLLAACILGQHELLLMLLQNWRSGLFCSVWASGQLAT